jgi:hypothetical protein
MIVREFNCPKHGPFESRFSMCPHGCVDVERVFTRAPAVKSRRTKNIDATLKQMAKDHHLSDISNKNGTLAASIPQFQPQPITADPQGIPAMKMYFEKQRQLFGGSIEMGKDGSFWASGMSFQRGTARPTGQPMGTFLDYEAPKASVAPVVQAACDNNGKLLKR